MSYNKDLYAVYANKDLAPPSSDYWAGRRRVAALMRKLQEKVQTTDFALADLVRLGDGLQQQLQSLPEAPAMEGRSAWLEDHRHGDFGILQTEVTPILGTSNPISPGLSIWFDDDVAHGALSFGWMYEGADNIVHGGWVAAVFDEFLGNAQALSGRTGMTGSLTVRYLKPAPLNQELLLQAKILSDTQRKIIAGGEMRAGDTLIASCEAVFVCKG